MAEPASEASAITAWARLVRTQIRVLGAVEADIKAAGLPPLSWYDVLLELREAGGGGLRPHQVESRMLLAQHNVSRLLDRLSAKNLVHRRPAEEDGRGHIVTITEAGRSLLRRMWPTYRGAIERHVGGKLSEREAKLLAGLLGKLLDRP